MGITRSPCPQGGGGAGQGRDRAACVRPGAGWARGGSSRAVKGPGCPERCGPSRGSPAPPPAVVSHSRGLSAMGAVWSALLVGGSLAGALFVWLLRGGPGDAGISKGAEPDKEAPAREAATPGGRPGGGDDSGGLSPGPGKRELDSKAGISRVCRGP